MKQLAPSRVHWHVYLGRNVFTADNQRIGVVEGIYRDDSTRVLFIRIRNESNHERTMDLPASAIGVISPQRLMLDVSSDQLSVPWLNQSESRAGESSIVSILGQRS